MAEEQQTIKKKISLTIKIKEKNILIKRHNQKNKDNPQTRSKYCNRTHNLQRAYIQNT